MNKRFLLFIFAACLLSNTQSRAMENNTAGKLIGTFLVGGAIVGSTEWLSKNPLVKSLCKRANLDANDVKRVINLSSACVATSFFTNKETSDSLIDFAWKAPLIGAVYTLSNTQILKSVIRNAPFGLGAYLVCPNPHESQVPSLRVELIEKIDNDETMGDEEKARKKAEIRNKIFKTCHGGCDECQWTSAVKIVAAWTMVKYGAPIVWEWTKTKLGYQL